MDDEAKDVVKSDEEQTVSDVDADTKDVEETQKSGESEIIRMFEEFQREMRQKMEYIDADIRSIKDAQSITIDNGAIIRDDSEPDPDDDYVDTRTIAELDLTI